MTEYRILIMKGRVVLDSFVVRCEDDTDALMEGDMNSGYPGSTHVQVQRWVGIWWLGFWRNI